MQISIFLEELEIKTSLNGDRRIALINLQKIHEINEKRIDRGRKELKFEVEDFVFIFMNHENA